MRGSALIVLAWNQWELTRRCLDSLLASDLDAADVIVVDNGSTDATTTDLDAYADRVRLVRLPDNSGFVRGMNAGIAAANADDDVVLLNNDLLFTQHDWLGRLRDAAYAEADIGIVGCRLLGPQPEGRLYHAGGFIEADDLWGQQTESGVIERDVAQYSSLRRVQGIAFAMAYIRRDCLDRIGALDTAFNSYFEDTDYCLRAAAAGIATVVAGAVTLRHDQHGSTADDGGFRQRLWDASRAAFAARWQSRLRADYRANVLWQGVTRFPSAHAQLTHLLLRRLDARGLRMGFEPTRHEVAATDDFRLQLATRRRWQPPADAALVCAPGPAFAQAQGRHRIGLGFGDWERVPPAWATAARALDLLLVPDAFQHDAFRASGVRVPMEIVPLGVDRDYCHPRVPAPRNPRADFVFLAIAEELARDAPQILVAAFRRAFVRDEPVELIIHLRPGHDAPALEDAVRVACGDDARIRVLSGWGFPWHQRAQLLCAADAYVSARRGGGWDPAAAEALACGRVLVATDWGSQAELVRAHGLAVDVARLVEAPDHAGLRWAEPDPDALAERLHEAFERRVELVASAHAQAPAFAGDHDIDASADALFTAIAQHVPLAAAPAPPPAHRPAQLTRAASGQIVVLGMHRSGTSAVAGLLARMGVAVGPAHDLLRGPDNPKGHYESARLHAACVRRLAAAGGDWKQPPSGAPDTAVDAFRREVGTLIDEFDAQRPWLVKEPRLCLLAQELLPLLTRPLFVHVVREPREIAASLMARDGFTAHDALALWETYTRAAFAASRGWPRVIVDYAELVATPLDTARRLRAQLRALGIDGVNEADVALVRDWIEPRHGATTPRGSEFELTPAQRELQGTIADRSIVQSLPADAAPAAPRARGAR